MTAAVVVIGVFPQDPTALKHAITLPGDEPRSIGFTETTCDDCKAPCWIGPNQLEAYQTRRGPTAILCYSCVLFGQGIVIVKHVNPRTQTTETPQ